MSAIHPKRRVPRIIHQTWKNTQIPAFMRPWQESWQRHNPDWTYRLWTDEDNYRLVAEHYPWILSMYEQYPQNIMRVDLARCLILHHHGGVYADLDFECLRPLDELLAAYPDGNVLIGQEPAAHAVAWKNRHGATPVAGTDRMLCNAFLASTCAHPFWEFFVADMQKNSTHPDPLFATGPWLLTSCWLKYPKAGEITLVASADLYPLTAGQTEAGAGFSSTYPARHTAFAVHHWSATWVRRSFYKHLAQQAIRLTRGPLRRLAMWGYVALRAVKRMLLRLLRGGPPPLYEPRPAHPARRLAAGECEQKILIAVPIKDAVRFLPDFLDRLGRLAYSRHRLSLAFLESDSRDGTWDFLQKKRAELESHYRRFCLWQENFNYHPVRARNHPAEQLMRRSILARSRNRLLRASLEDEDWVLWMDADVAWWPDNVLHCLLASDGDIVVPSCLTPYGRDFDLNTFVADPSLSEEDWRVHIRDGLLQPPAGFGRRYLSEFRGRGKVEVDGVGATMLLVRADLHREGLIFPEQPYRHYIETEGLAAMARDRGTRCWGLPDLEIIHPLY